VIPNYFFNVFLYTYGETYPFENPYIKEIFLDVFI